MCESPIDRLPVELLQNILEDVSADPESTVAVVTRRASLRLVCKFWAEALLPSLQSTLVLWDPRKTEAQIEHVRQFGLEPHIRTICFAYRSTGDSDSFGDEPSPVEDLTEEQVSSLTSLVQDLPRLQELVVDTRMRLNPRADPFEIPSKLFAAFSGSPNEHITQIRLEPAYDRFWWPEDSFISLLSACPALESLQAPGLTLARKDPLTPRPVAPKFSLSSLTIGAFFTDIKDITWLLSNSSDTLTHLSIHIDLQYHKSLAPRDFERDRFAKLLIDSCPNLETLTVEDRYLHGDAFDEEDEGTIMEKPEPNPYMDAVVSHLHNLKSLTLKGPIASISLLHLLSKSPLEDLALTVDDELVRIGDVTTRVAKGMVPPTLKHFTLLRNGRYTLFEKPLCQWHL